MPAVMTNTNRLTIVGRDTCTGTCETHVGCDCIAPCPPCNQRCNQGRQCPANTPAEACTDVGTEEDRPPMTSRDARVVVLLITLPWALFALAAWAWVSFR